MGKSNSNIGHIGTVDNLGRIVVPSSMRKALDIEKGQSLEMVVVEDGILLRKYQPGCMFCGEMLGVTMFGGKLICKECIRKMYENI